MFSSQGFNGLLILLISIALSSTRPQQQQQQQQSEDMLAMKTSECNKPNLELLLLQTNSAHTFGRTKYGVCPKEATEEEHDLLEKLKQLRSIGMDEYLQRKQKCKLSQMHFPAPGKQLRFYKIRDFCGNSISRNIDFFAFFELHNLSKSSLRNWLKISAQTKK